MPVLNLVATAIAPGKLIPPPAGAATDLGTRWIFSDDLRDKNTNALVGQHTGEWCLSGSRTCGCATLAGS
jgi:hypothetical protein